MRGRSDGAAAKSKSKDVSKLSKVSVETVDSDDEDDCEQTVCSDSSFSDDDSEMAIPLGDPREAAATLSLKSLQREQRHHAALEVSKHAAAMMKELEIPDEPLPHEKVIVSDEEALAERLLGALAVHLASGTTVKKRKGFVDAQKLAKNWKIGQKAAERTVEATTQMAVRDFSSTTGARKLKPRHWVLDHKRLGTDVSTDTLFGKCKSLRGNTCAQVYSTPFHWVKSYPMTSKSEAHYTLDDMFNEVGVPRRIVSDGAKEFIQGEFKRKCKRAQ